LYRASFHRLIPSAALSGIAAGTFTSLPCWHGRGTCFTCCW